LIRLFYQALSKGKQMLGLAIAAWILGTLAVGAGLFAVGAPDLVRQGLEKFPRSVTPGRVLFSIDMVWAACAVSPMHLGGFDGLKVHLYWLVPVCIVLGCLYLDELLSVRSLGGLLLLAAGPLLSVARFPGSNWGYVISVLAYVWIAFGLLFLLCPWWFRRMVLLIPSATAVRAGGALKALFGVGLIVLALFAF
jgi:hypothetical protein